MKWVRRRGFEAESIVETAGVLVCMGRYCSYSHNLGGCDAPEQGVLQERSANSFSLVMLIYGQAGDQEDGKWPFGRLPFEKSFSGVARFHLPDGKRVEARHPAIVHRYERSG